jgi:hypothetical protein
VATMSASAASGTTSWISFGPDLEPLALESRRMAAVAAPRQDGLLVVGEPSDIVSALARACVEDNGWCELRCVIGDGAQRPVHVQARHARFVVAAPVFDE